MYSHRMLMLYTMSVALAFVSCLPSKRAAVVLVDVLDEESSLENEIMSSNLQIVPRADWLARKPKATEVLTTPVPYVVIHHSYTPKACYNREECDRAMRSMQDFHMDDRGWNDIGYNFGVGSDGVAYEGRGFTVLGAHSLHFNTVSIGICLIGDWTGSLPPKTQIQTAQALIAEGVSKGFIRPDYKLVGHRQVRDTLCPGDRLFEEIQKWPQHVKFPGSCKDLKNVTELPDSVKNLPDTC